MMMRICAGTRGFVTAEATIGCPQFESSDPAIAEIGDLSYHTDDCAGYWTASVASHSPGDIEITFLDRDGARRDAIAWRVREARRLAVWHMGESLDAIALDPGDTMILLVHGEDEAGLPLDVGLLVLSEIGDPTIAAIQGWYSPPMPPRVQGSPLEITGVARGETTLRFEVGGLAGEIAVMVE